MSVFKMKPTLNGEGGQGGGEGIEYVELEYIDNYTFTLTQEQATKLQNGAFIKLISSDIFVGIAIPLSATEYSTACNKGRKGIFFHYVNVDYDGMTYYTNFVELQAVTYEPGE